MFIKLLVYKPMIASNKPLLQSYPHFNHFSRRQNLSQNYYQILGIDERCDRKRIRVSYLKLCKRFHPDLNQSDDQRVRQQNHTRLQDINTAYKCLINDDRRRDYDRWMRESRTDRFHGTSYYSHYTGSDSWDSRTRPSYGSSYGRPYGGHRTRYADMKAPHELYPKEKVLLGCFFLVFIGCVLHLFQYAISKRSLQRMDEKWRNNGRDYQHVVNNRQSYEEWLKSTEELTRDKK